MANKKDVSFEEAMVELEQIVEELEKGDVPLERAIDFYQEGMKLSKLCNDKLTNAQDKMTQILNEQGELAHFDLQEEE